jgi:hypothetical protein
MRSVKEFFNFPIRVYDRVSATKIERDHAAFFTRQSSDEDEEEMIDKELDKLKVEPSWVRGFARIPVDEIKGIVDALSLDQDVKEVANSGFKFTIVMTKNLGDFMCTWNKERFETELDKHLASLEN